MCKMKQTDGSGVSMGYGGSCEGLALRKQDRVIYPKKRPSWSVQGSQAQVLSVIPGIHQLLGL